MDGMIVQIAMVLMVIGGAIYMIKTGRNMNS